MKDMPIWFFDHTDSRLEVPFGFHYTDRMKNKITIGELKKGQQFKHGNEGGVYRCANPYWPEARNPAYRAAKIVVVVPPVLPEGTYPIVVGQCVTFNHRTKVELLSA